MGGSQGQQFMLEKETEYKSMSPTMSNITCQFTGRPINLYLYLYLYLITRHKLNVTFMSIYLWVNFIGMDLSNIVMVGLMDQLILHNVQFKQVEATHMISM